MIASQARIEANRRNASKSTGPKTARGKGRSRGNALKHGLCSMTVVTEHRELVQERTGAFVEALQPEDDFERWLVGQAAVLSLRVERCQRMEGCARDKLGIRAEFVWDDDRRLEAIRLARKLGDEPELVVEQLRQTPHGCDWLIGRWALLEHAAGSAESWSPVQARLALDLLGTPAEFREGNPMVADPAAIARRAMAELEQRRDLVAGLDEADRALAEADLDDETSPELKRLRRYESALQRQLRWYLEQLGEPSISESPAPRAPEPDRPALDESPPEVPTPSTEVESSPSPIPAANRFANLDLPFGIRPTLDQFAEVPEGPLGRAEQKLRKAEGRRDAKRRKLERLRS
jgi:hypothetical protein